MNGVRSAARPMPGWEHFAHVADIGVRGFGPSMERAFEQAALAMISVISDLSTIRACETVDIACRAPDADFLLADWLNAIVFEMATRNMLFSRFEVTITENRLRGRASGEAVDVARHKPAAEIKGATLSELKVTQTSDGRWIAQCIVDV